MQMKRVFLGKKLIALGLSGMVVLSGCADGKIVQETEASENVKGSDAAEFDAYTEELFRKEIVENTINLHYILAYPENYGITDYEVSLGTVGMEELEESYEELEVLEQELLSFRRNELTKSQKLTYDILMDYAKTELKAKDLLLYTEFLSPLTGYQAQLPVILAEYGFRTKRDIDDYISLLSQMDELFEEVIAFEKEKSKAGLFMPDYAADAVIEQCEQFIADPENNYMIEVFDDAVENFAGISKEEKETYQQKNYDIVTTQVVDAYQILIEGLEELKGTGKNEKGLCYYEDGKEYYEYLIRTMVGSELSVEEMQEQTQDYMRTWMRNIAVTLEASPELISQAMNYEFPVTEPKEVLEDLKQKMAEDFPKPPDVDYTIKSVHPSMEEHASPAFYLTTPLDDYTNNVIYINDSYYQSEYRNQNIYTTLAHEGYPGHLYQNVYTASSGLHPVRSLFSCTGYAEGWATYVENYAYHISGLEENLADVLAWNNALTLGMYAYADMGVHYDGWEREDLAEYLAAYGFSDEEIVNTMYEMLVEEPANYLNYFIGYLEILNLRDEMEEEMGNDFVLKDFQEAFLKAGPAPFYILEDYLLDDIE